MAADLVMHWRAVTGREPNDTEQQIFDAFQGIIDDLGAAREPEAYILFPCGGYAALPLTDDGYKHCLAHRGQTVRIVEER